MRWLIFILLSIPVWADPAVSLVPVVEQFIPTLSGKTVHAIGADSRFGFDLEPLWRSFFRAVNHRDKSVIRKFDSPALCEISAAYRFDPVKRQLSVILYLFENGTYVKCSPDINVTAETVTLIPDFRSRFDGSIEEQRLLFRGKLVDRLQQMALSGKIPSMLRTTRMFRIANPQSVYGDWKQLVFCEQLSSQFGVHFTDRADRTITFDPSGAVIFSDGHEQQFLTTVLPARVVTRSERKLNYLAPVQSGNSFERIAATLPLEQKILSKIETFFSSTYPNLFEQFNSDKLLHSFADIDKPMVLNGTVSGDETVRYSWTTPRKWVSSLEAVVNNARKFKVDCTVREIIQDTQNQHRFWAVVDQQWQTLDQDGHERYKDTGFLIVNFDFYENGEVESVKIQYRIWIYDYPFTFGSEIDVRKVKLKGDLCRTLDAIKGIDSSLKEQVKESILEAQKTM